MSVKIKKVKAPLKKYKKIIDEFQEVKREELEKADYNELYKEKGIGLIQQLIINNGLNQDLICEVFGCTPSTYSKFFLNALDDTMYEYMLNQFCILFRCQSYDLHTSLHLNVTYVPKWADTYWRMKYYMKYNRMILFFRDIWGFDDEIS